MALHFILGASGSGKSTYLFQKIREEAARHPHTNYMVLVPDQFTLETQRTLVEMSEGKGILNIDVLSFQRMAYRAFEEVPALRRTVLEDEGKIMILRKVFTEQKKNLQYFRRGQQGAGFLDECKSFLCELTQYAVSEEDLEKMTEKVGKDSLMGMKLQDIRLIYHSFQEKMGDTYMMAEELVPQLTRVVGVLDGVKDSVVCLDGFTGFTPTQYELLSELLKHCRDVFVTVTTDRTGRRSNIFSISTDTITRLSKLANERGVEVKEAVFAGMGEQKIPFRTAKNEELSFLEKNLFVYGAKPWESIPKNVEITLCHREMDEAAYVARRIYYFVKEKGYCYENIAVVTAKPDVYEQMLASEMDKFGIRYFMDNTKNIGANAMAEYVMAFINMVEKGMDYESTFRFLRGALSPLSIRETDLMENYVLAKGRRGFSAYKEKWIYEAAGLDLVELNEYRQKFVDSIEEAVTALEGGKKTVREYTEILYHFVIKNRVYEQLQELSTFFEAEGELILAREYRSIYRLMMKLWDEMVELLGGETVSFREYEELLQAGISEGLVGFIPPTSHQVIVGDVRRSRLKNIKILFFVGVNDDCIPKAKGAPGILSENERRQLKEAGIELAPDAEKESYTEQFYLYLALTKASEQVILTYSSMTAGGESKRPAYLTGRIKKIFPKMEIRRDEEDNSREKILGGDRGKSYLIRKLSMGEYEKDTAFWELAAYYERKTPGVLQSLMRLRQQSAGKTALKKEAAEQLYGKVLDGSVTRLEQFIKCPYAHFARYGLLLAEREQYEIGALDHGNIFHKALEHFSHEMEKGKKDWQDLTEEEALELAKQSTDYAVEHYQGQKYFQTHRSAFMIRRLKNEMVHSVHAMWHQMKEGDFHQFYTEKRFGGDGEKLSSVRIPLDSGEIALRGMIDRVDICDAPEGNLIKIVDYKSSDAVDLSLAQVYHGLQMQLVTYLTAAEELVRRDTKGEVIPAAMLYYAIKEKNLEWCPEDEESHWLRVMEQMKGKGYVNEEPSVINRLEPGAAGGKNPRVLSTEQFKILMEHTREKMKESGNRILAGEIEAKPYVFGRETGCRYCPYASVCGIEKRSKNVCVMEEMTDEEVWEVLHERD